MEISIAAAVYFLIAIAILIGIRIESNKQGVESNGLQIIVAFIWPLWLLWYLYFLITDYFKK